MIGWAANQGSGGVSDPAEIYREPLDVTATVHSSPITYADLFNVGDLVNVDNGWCGVVQLDYTFTGARTVGGTPVFGGGSLYTGASYIGGSWTLTPLYAQVTAETFSSGPFWSLVGGVGTVRFYASDGGSSVVVRTTGVVSIRGSVPS